MPPPGLRRLRRGAALRARRRPRRSSVSRGGAIGLTICEDLWNDKDFFRARRLYRDDPGETLLARGADLIVNVSASPFSEGKPRLRRRMLARLARDGGVPVAYLNLVGGNDELVFDGGSMVLDGRGRVRRPRRPLRGGLRRRRPRRARASRPSPARSRPTFPTTPRGSRSSRSGARSSSASATTRGSAGSGRAVVGLSGGIDSALVGALAVDALGAENVTGLALPSRYSSEGSIADARALAEALGIRLEVVPIEPLFAAAKATLAPLFAGRPEDVTEENLQARIRGMLLMAFSNKLGPLLLTTGNKSELAVGYCTLYGDMCGGLAPISDLPKMRVYALARHLNRRAGRELIPASTLEKAPSAELRPGQTDQDSLPPYELLDRVLEGLVERNRTPAAVAREVGAPGGARRRDRAADRPGRVQAAAGRPRPEGLDEGVRERPPHPDRAGLQGVKYAGELPRSRYPWKEIPGSSHDVLLSRIAALGAGLSVLDVGFGAGHLARRIRPCCRYLAGIELDPEAALRRGGLLRRPARRRRRPRARRARGGSPSTSSSRETSSSTSPSPSSRSPSSGRS